MVLSAEESESEQPASSAAPTPAAPASRILRRGPERVRDGRVNGTADVLGGLVRTKGAAGP